MSPPVSVFFRPVTGEEAVKLRRLSRQSKVFALRRRPQIFLASDAQSTASEVARVLQTDENQDRRVIREFNEMGMDFLRPRCGGGRRGGSTTRAVSGSVLSPSPVPKTSESPSRAGRPPGCAATWSEKRSSTSSPKSTSGGS